MSLSLSFWGKERQFHATSVAVTVAVADGVAATDRYPCRSSAGDAASSEALAAPSAAAAAAAGGGTERCLRRTSAARCRRLQKGVTTGLLTNIFQEKILVLVVVGLLFVALEAPFCGSAVAGVFHG